MRSDDRNMEMTNFAASNSGDYFTGSSSILSLNLLIIKL